jgi:D-alanyl-lipoteichoic acid acyltransferase DltB (MBOAT superfamily)
VGAAPLPLGISFFTFTQIAFLVDLHRREASRPDAPRYALFVTFFPHLVAGPLYHHAQVMPQFEAPNAFRARPDHLAAGLDLLVLGLFKKCVIADHLAPFANAMFDAASRGEAPGTVMAWAGILAYTFQIYFDFSGYSDMAMGLARMLGVRLPVNFDAPYRAASIVEFWRRWHMTLSAFLRDYLYIPLGGNRFGPARRYANLMVTMLLGGLWHGAAWTFILWGGVHGAMLCANHLWHARFPAARAGPGRRLLGIAATFVAVALAWVLFRAPTLPAALVVYRAALAFAPTPGPWPVVASLYIAAAALMAFTLPVSWRFVEAQHDASRATTPRPAFGLAVGALAFMAVDAMVRTTPAPFLYFNF